MPIEFDEIKLILHEQGETLLELLEKVERLVLAVENLVAHLPVQMIPADPGSEVQ